MLMNSIINNVIWAWLIQVSAQILEQHLSSLIMLMKFQCKHLNASGLCLHFWTCAIGVNKCFFGNTFVFISNENYEVVISWSVSECLRSDRQRKTACRPSSNQKYYLWMSSHVHPTKENTYTLDDKLCINPLPLILYYIFTLLLCPNMLQKAWIQN